MWQTPVSNVSPRNSTPFASSSSRAAATSSTWKRRVSVSLRRELHPELLGLPDAEAGVAGPEVVLRPCWSWRRPSVSDVELLGAVGVLGWDADEVDFADQGMPPEGLRSGHPRLRSRPLSRRLPPLDRKSPRIPRVALPALPQVRLPRMGRPGSADRADQAGVRRRGALGLRGGLHEDARGLPDPPRAGGQRALHLLRAHPRRDGWARSLAGLGFMLPGFLLMLGVLDPLRGGRAFRQPRRALLRARRPPWARSSRER